MVYYIGLVRWVSILVCSVGLFSVVDMDLARGEVRDSHELLGGGVEHPREQISGQLINKGAKQHEGEAIEEVGLQDSIDSRYTTTRLV